jgi:hypothetical protein
MKLQAFKYFAAFFLVTAVFGAVYVSLQQNYRRAANSPQIQIVQDTVNALNHGSVPHWDPVDQMNIANSQSAFIVIFDASGTPVAGSGILNGKLPQPPLGVFDSVHKYGTESITWQTPGGLRFAAVIAEYHEGYILSARSLIETEKRESALLWEIGLPWLLAVLILAGYFLRKEKTAAI